MLETDILFSSLLILEKRENRYEIILTIIITREKRTYGITGRSQTFYGLVIISQPIKLISRFLWSMDRTPGSASSWSKKPGIDCLKLLTDFK